MTMTAEWRKYGEFDVILVLDGGGTVREAITANTNVLHQFLEAKPNIADWTGDRDIDDGMMSPETWGSLVMARTDIGEIITMDPEQFWAGIHMWFRSRGIDYDTPLARISD